MTLEWSLFSSYVKKAGFSLQHFRHSHYMVVHTTKATAERQVLF